ncbi:MAG: L-seryl-tRNA(Sec) selenium transferase, partial [Anaerolineales bacterium]
MTELRRLPSVHKLLNAATAVELIADFGRALTLEAVRATLDEVRARFKESQLVPGQDALLQRAGELLDDWTSPTLQPAINATGVIIHTNLGRAPLSRAAIEAMQAVALGYSNLEYDLARGRRGSRYTHAEDLIKRITGAEAALIVNNNAAAVMLALSVLAKRRRVLISRTQLIEIGGGFRIPDVMKQSGAKLVEIGATNRVHLRDYQQALEEQPIALLLTAHQSNFRIVGFTTEPSRAELAALAREHGIPYVEARAGQWVDLGEGATLRVLGPGETTLAIGEVNNTSLVLKLEWGNDEAVIEMVHRIAERKGLGDILAEGPLRAAEKIGKDSLKYNIQVKG